MDDWECGVTVVLILLLIWWLTRCPCGCKVFGCSCPPGCACGVTAENCCGKK